MEPQRNHFPWRVEGSGVLRRDGVLDVLEHRAEVRVANTTYGFVKLCLMENVVLAVVPQLLLEQVVQDILLFPVPYVTRACNTWDIKKIRKGQVLGRPECVRTESRTGLCFEGRVLVNTF